MMSGRVSGWQWTPFSPAAFFSAISASMTPAFSQWTPQMPPFSFSFFSALYMASSPIIMAGSVMYILKEEIPSAYISSISRSMVSFQSSMVMWKP